MKLVDPKQIQVYRDAAIRSLYQLIREGMATAKYVGASDSILGQGVKKGAIAADAKIPSDMVDRTVNDLHNLGLVMLTGGPNVALTQKGREYVESLLFEKTSTAWVRWGWTVTRKWAIEGGKALAVATGAAILTTLSPAIQGLVKSLLARLGFHIR